MSFLSAIFLVALPLVAVPVAIHLYRGRQREVVPWGAMQFLAAAVTQGRSMQRLEEWLLLLLRLGAVAALVLALAQPMVRSSWLGPATDREVILVLDNSLSMSRQIDGHSAADRMQAEAQKLISSLSPSDGVQVRLAAGAEWLTSAPIAADSNGRRQLREILQRVAPTEGAAQLLECVQDAVHLHADQQLAARHVVVFTDGQATSWQTDAAAAWQRLAADRQAASLPITIAVVNCDLQSPDIENLAVTQLQSASSVVRPGEQIEVAAEILNAGNVPSKPTTLEWLLAGERVTEWPVGALEPGARTQVSAALRMAEAGVYAVGARIADADQVPLDQENSLVVEVADELPVLFVFADDQSSELPADHLFAAALGHAGEQPQAWRSIFRPTAIGASQLAGQSLAGYRAVVINDVARLDPSTLERLDSYVRAGGGLWVALGERADRADFDRDWYRAGDGLSPLALEAFVLIDDAEDVAATVHPPSRDHPATAGLADTTQLDIDEARIHERWVFAERGDRHRTANVILQAGDGQPLVVEQFVGQGRVLMQSFPLGLEWSNLPLLKAYVVMIHDWLDYLTAPRRGRYNLQPGAPIVVDAPQGAAAGPATLITPQGREIALVETDSPAAAYRFSHTRLPGMYRMRFTQGSSLVGDVPFHVSRDAAQSLLLPLDEADRAALLEPAGIDWTTAAAALPRPVDAALRHNPVWGALLAVLVVLLAGDLLLSSRVARRRSGPTVTTSSPGESNLVKQW